MENSSQRPWYKKKRYIIPTALTGIFLLGGGNGQNSATPTTPTPIQVKQHFDNSTIKSNQLKEVDSVQKSQVENKEINVTGQKEISNNPDPKLNNNLTNDNYYTNVDGNTVHSPAYTPDNSIPQGASARCRDGTYSFSQHRQGTCSRHGGVSEWL